MTTPRPASPYSDPDPIPHIDTAMVPFTSTAQLRQRWRALMGPLGFAEPRVWTAFVVDHRITPPLTHATLPTVPDPVGVDQMMKQFTEMLSTVPGSSLALLLTRPGGGGITPRDLGWARLIADASVRHGTDLHPLHRADDETLVTLPVALTAAA